jgi:hypothetical protein
MDEMYSADSGRDPVAVRKIKAAEPKVLIRILEVPGSNLGPETGYSEPDCASFFSVPTGKCQDSTLKLVHDHFFPNPFRFIIHLSAFHWMPYSLSH